MLYQSTCVGLGYGLNCRCCFPEVPGRPLNPIRADDFRPSSHSGRRRNVNPLPIGYGCRPRLRGPANPARINLAQEPLDFRREGLSPSLPLLMSAFALPIPPGGVTPSPFAGLRNAPLPRTCPIAQTSTPAASVRGFSPVTSSAQDFC